ncbi:MAG TPA: O-antigen ligase family protein [Pyrinomonadaceae bacterium]|jgi:O-antigen ligase|nr:O-antigen ligase family protein [Pyrinomonadaceae bacterium]
MLTSARTFAREPLRFVGVLWPLALLVPFLPGLPRPANGGLTWRQEGTVALLLCATFALLWRRARESRRREGRAQERSLPAGIPNIRGLEPALVVTLAAFVAWGAASTLWAGNLFPAVHYALSWTTYLLFFFTLRRAAESARLLCAALTLLAVVVVVVSAANIVGYYGSPDSLMRQNGLGEPLAVSIPLFAALALRLRRARAALLCGAAATLGWLSMLEIAERAPFFGVLTGLALVAAFALARAPFRPRSFTRALALAAAFAACLALQTVPSPFAQSRHETMLARVKETSTPADVNTRARMLYWGAAIEMWRAHPLNGVGAGGYDGAFPLARAAFAARHPDSPLVEINERYLSSGAHDEYLQILSELGAVGLSLFAAFCAALAWAAWRALRNSNSPLAPGAVASLAVFAVSSGASSVSFRWFGSGLIFFFAAAIVTRFALDARREPDPAQSAPHAATLKTRATTLKPLHFPPAVANFTHALARARYALGLTAALVVLVAMCAQATNVLLLASAQATTDDARAETLYRSALALNPLDAATHYNYGVWLLFRKRDGEAVPHLSYALARGFHTSTCYEYLAGAESNAGQAEAAERTLAEGARVYPRSVFMRVRHAAALARLGRPGNSELEMRAALLLDSRAARGWRRLIDEDIDAAIADARRDPTVSMPGELQPEDAVFAVLEENERRFPDAVMSGWRARMRASELR